jgi:hypothetical protein
VKKGRHRRFEEARKLKQQGPGAFLPVDRNGRDEHAVDDDEFADLAAKYGAFDDDDEDDEG